VNLTDVIDSLVEERGLEREVLTNVVCEGMLSAYQKCYPGLSLRVFFSKKDHELIVEIEKRIVISPSDELSEISLRKARNLVSSVEEGDSLWLPFEKPVGRREILVAKQIIAQKIRQIEASIVYNEFKSREGSIMQGVVHKIERGGSIIKIQDNLAFLPKSLIVPGEKLIVGHPIRALLKEVLVEPRNENQLILDRASSDFVKILFELEIPEVFERIVEIRSIVRTAGYKSKVIVSSRDANIDPVGTCVGVGGVRIKPILKELGNEKIDIIAWTDDSEVLIENALKPAEINRVELSGNEKIARVWLDDDQRSLAIGKMGQNISLASQLVGIDIELVKNDTKDLEQKLLNQEL